MCDTFKTDLTPSNDSTDVLTSKKDQATEPLRRFDVQPAGEKEPIVLAPVAPPPATVLIVQQPRLFTDQQLVAILIVLFAIVCFGILAHAIRT